MESFAFGIGNLIGFQLILGFMFGIYLTPLIIAAVRGHHRWPWIGFLNFTAGWTVAGWIAALVWSVTAIRQPASVSYRITLRDRETQTVVGYYDGSWTTDRRRALGLRKREVAEAHAVRMRERCPRNADLIKVEELGAAD